MKLSKRKLYKAKPTPTRIIVAPGQGGQVTVLRHHDAARLPLQAVEVEADFQRNAPVSGFSERFKAAMRAQGLAVITALMVPRCRRDRSTDKL
jgi:hypothetical protein